MVTFTAVYEAEAYRKSRQQDAAVYRQQHSPVQKQTRNPAVVLSGLLVSAMLVKQHKAQG